MNYTGRDGGDPGVAREPTCSDAGLVKPASSAATRCQYLNIAIVPNVTIVVGDVGVIKATAECTAVRSVTVRFIDGDFALVELTLGGIEIANLV
jgi:hypothetical protein